MTKVVMLTFSLWTVWNVCMQQKAVGGVHSCTDDSGTITVLKQDRSSSPGPLEHGYSLHIRHHRVTQHGALRHHRS